MREYAYQMKQNVFSFIFSYKIITYLSTCLCVKMEFVVGITPLPCELYSLSNAAFVYVRPAQLCIENGVSIYMCSAVEVVLRKIGFL